MKLSVDIRKKLPGFDLNVRFETNGSGTGILGASGSGKSMTLRCIAGMETPDSGRITLGDRVLYDSEKRINQPARERGIGMLFQHYALFPHMTAAENVGFGLDHLTKAERNKRVEELLALVRLDSFGGRYPAELSGGQQQRIAVARALSVNPDAMLFDEPFSALDDHLRALMIREFMEILSSYHGAMLVVTHNVDEAFRLCGNLVVLDGGSVKGAGDTRDVFERPPSLEAARVTGCKNISKVRRISGRSVYSDAWKCELVTEMSVNDDVSYAGIRANYLKLDESGSVSENVIPCRVSGISESPFRMQIFLVPDGASPADDDSIIQWDIPKDKWARVKNLPQPLRMYADPVKVFVM